MKTLEKAQQERKEAQARKDEMKKRQMILTLAKSGDIARIRFLRSLDPLIDAKRHEVFDRYNPEASIRAMCATTYGKPCYWCAAFQSRKDNELRPRGIYIYPVWVYEVRNPELADESKLYYDEMAGYRLLALNDKSLLNDQLMSYHAEEGTVTGCDWKYTRIGSGKETKYTLTSKVPTPFDHEDLERDTPEDILYLMNEAYPMRVTSEGTPF